MQLTSSVFQQGQPIPEQYTCEGRGTSPELSWTDPPKETKSFALIVHDPDAPRANGFTHWLLYNIPHTVDRINANLPHTASIPGLGLQGKNDSGKIGYIGPCPPSGSHRYFFRLSALRTKLDLQPGATYKDLLEAMEGKIIEHAELMGTYAKKGQKAA